MSQRTVEQARQWVAEAEAKLRELASRPGGADRWALHRATVSLRVRRAALAKAEDDERRRGVFHVEEW